MVEHLIATIIGGSVELYRGLVNQLISQTSRQFTDDLLRIFT